MSENSPVLFQTASDNVSGPAARLSLGGFSADLMRGDVRVTAEITFGLKARMFVLYDDLHVMVEADMTRWRASIALGGWRPLTNLARLAERMMGGMDAIYVTMDTVPDFVQGRFVQASDRLRPLGRAMFLASEALDSVWNADPGWIVGVDAMGRIQDPLGLQLDPLFEVSVTATLIF